MPHTQKFRQARVIALILVVVFSVLLCVLAFTDTQANPSVVEVVKASFTLILGFFFGSLDSTGGCNRLAESFSRRFVV